MNANRLVNYALVASLVAVWAIMMHEEFSEPPPAQVQTVKQQRRQDIANSSFCIKLHGPGAKYYWDANGVLVCEPKPKDQK